MLARGLVLFFEQEVWGSEETHRSWKTLTSSYTKFTQANPTAAECMFFMCVHRMLTKTDYRTVLLYACKAYCVCVCVCTCVGAYFILLNVPQFHPGCHKCQEFILFYGRVVPCLSVIGTMFSLVWSSGGRHCTFCSLAVVDSVAVNTEAQMSLWFHFPCI